MDIKEYRLKVQQKIEQFEIEEKWDQDVEDDPRKGLVEASY